MWAHLRQGLFLLLADEYETIKFDFRDKETLCNNFIIFGDFAG